MAQEKHCWLIRRNRDLLDIFEKAIYGNPQASGEILPEPCCVSFDGCAALFRPYASQLKLHVDLVPGLPGFDFGSVQGAYNLYDVHTSPDGTRATGGFVCVVGSHKHYNQMWEDRMHRPDFTMPTKHWHVLEPDSPLQEHASLVISPANSFVLWRSDLLHKNYGGDYSWEELSIPGE